MYCTVGNDKQNQSGKGKRAEGGKEEAEREPRSLKHRLYEDAETQIEPKSFDNIYKEKKKKKTQNTQ